MRIGRQTGVSCVRLLLSTGKVVMIPKCHLVLAAVGDGPLEKVLANELTKAHKVALGPVYPLDDFHRDGFDIAYMFWYYKFGGMTYNSRTKDWDWVLALARVIGFLNTDGWISEEQVRSDGSTNYHCSNAYLGTLYDVYRFKEDLFTVCDEWGGLSEDKRDNSLVYRVSLPESSATVIAQIDGQTTGRRTTKVPLHSTFTLGNCPVPVLRAYLSGCMSGDGCVAVLNNDSSRTTSAESNDINAARPCRNWTAPVNSVQSVMAAYSDQHGFPIGRGSSIPRIPVRSSNFAPFSTVDMDTYDTGPRHFNWARVFVQCAMPEYADAMRGKLQEMVEMFARCGIIGLSVKGYAGKARQIQTEVFREYGLNRDAIRAQQQAIAKIAYRRLQWEKGLDLTFKKALADAHRQFGRRNHLISEYSRVSYDQSHLYCKNKGNYNLEAPKIGGGAVPYLRNSRVCPYFNNCGRRVKGEGQRKPTYAYTQPSTALPLYLVDIAAITEPDSVEECIAFADLPAGSGLQCDGVMVFPN
ncbi:hypothetical protein GGI17_005836 [Coemansia sp. S146]|nr:hypothetical protein GGI17_005836 [Coemansia sp. S146]